MNKTNRYLIGFIGGVCVEILIAKGFDVNPFFILVCMILAFLIDYIGKLK